MIGPRHFASHASLQSRMACLGIALGLLAADAAELVSGAEPERPNIVLILTDDLGYGDPGCYNPESKIATPHIDRIAAEGTRFVDAHAAAAVCVPTRYGLLTGRYPFRTTSDWRRSAVIEPDRVTLASLLSDHGYDTAMIGKWHLGFDGGPDYEYAKPLAGGPVDRGFHRYFGIPHSLDIEPYYSIRDAQAVRPPTESIEASSSPDWSPIQGKFWRAGKIAPGFQHHDVLPQLVEGSVNYLQSRSGETESKPFFLYVALASPHTPWLPVEEFVGKSGAGLYGDFVMSTDWAIGKILAELDRAGLADKTLLIFTNDNGPIWYERDIERFGHRANLNLRGMKGDAWEGGHRVPFIVRWPGHSEPGTVIEEMVCHTDLLATFADLLEVSLPDEAGEDSFSLLDIFLGQSGDRPVRETMITLSSQRVPAIRQGPWKLIPQLGSGGFISKPSKIEPEPGGPQGQLYNLSDDPGETKNLWDEQPGIVGRLMTLLDQAKRDGRTRTAE